jgi:hypothetical protein
MKLVGEAIGEADSSRIPLIGISLALNQYASLLMPLRQLVHLGLQGASQQGMCVVMAC